MSSAHLPHEQECRLVREFFRGRTGFFVDVGANEPQHDSQSHHLEQAGWTGVLIEPQPDLAARLRAERKGKVFAVACSSPENSGQTLPLYLAGPMSSLHRGRMAPGAVPQAKIDVPVTTLDSVLEQAAAPVPVDFVSLDVEGNELEVFGGFTLPRWQPRLILMEDHVTGLEKHRFLTARGYRLIRRTNFNGWYVPAGAEVDVSWRERWEILRKYYLALPFRILRNASRRLRQPFKDRRAARLSGH